MAHNCRRKIHSSILIVGLLLLGVPASIARADTVKNLVVHYVNATPRATGSTYDVAVYFSLLDASAIPIKDTQVSQLTLNEDGNLASIDSLALAENEPMDVALVLDTSGSMMWYNVSVVRTAVGHFLDSLGTDDRVAILTFDSDVRTLSDYTADKTTARQKIDLIQAKANSGTCLYDAVYKAVQMTSVLPSGRRAIVVLTDGKDSTLGNTPCSTYTLDDVLGLASQGATRVPLFTIGLGGSADTSTLKRMSGLTGGRYQSASDASKLDAMFLLLSNQLRLQYVLHYTSSSTPGIHILVLKVKYSSVEDEDTRNFVLPAFPYSLSFTSLKDGQEITGKTTISVSVNGQGPPIKTVDFLVNDVSIGTDDTPPYEKDWDPAANLSGTVTVTAVARDESNKELARSSISVKVVPPVAPTEAIISTTTPAGASSLFSGKNIGILIAVGVIVLFVVVVVIIVIAVSLRQRALNSERDRQWQATVNAPGSSASSDKTMDGFLPSANALGVLTVIQSDDPAMIGQRIEITQASTSLGRSASNDILFPKDSPVSRHHAVIEERNGQLILSETLSDSGGGKVKPPTFGTFVNNKQIGDPVPLRNGDEIRLGKRVRLQFEAVESIKKDEDRTIDQGPSTEDKTMDQAL